MQRKTERLHRVKCAALIALVMLMILLASTACAIDPIDESAKPTLTVVARYIDEKGKAILLKGMEFRLFRVADMTDFGTFTLCDPFTNAPVAVDKKIPTDLTSSEWSSRANTLDAYVLSNSIQPMMTKYTGSNGSLLFQDERRMSVGLYLVLSKPFKYNGYTYYADPALIALPNREESDDRWIYNVTMYPKIEREQDNLPQDVTIIKRWENVPQANRPECVKVALYRLRDNCLIETVTLCPKNNWTYKWSKLEPGKYKACELDVPSNTYEVKYDNREDDCGNILLYVINRIPNPKPTRPSTLPQTGQLWWPVPLLAGAGMVFFVIGWLRRRNDEED